MTTDVPTNDGGHNYKVYRDAEEAFMTVRGSDAEDDKKFEHQYFVYDEKHINAARIEEEAFAHAQMGRRCKVHYHAYSRDEAGLPNWECNLRCHVVEM